MLVGLSPTLTSIEGEVSPLNFYGDSSSIWDVYLGFIIKLLLFCLLGYSDLKGYFAIGYLLLAATVLVDSEEEEFPSSSDIAS